MNSNKLATLIRLADADLTVAKEAEDVRGRTVIDREGNEIGHVESLLIDENQQKVRFLEVTSGGFLGFGGQSRLIPLEAINRVADDAVHVDQTREHVHASPAYDPERASLVGAHYGDVYGYYGYAPFWAAGYVSAGYPNSS